MSLSNEDKQWISEQLGVVERHFDEKLERVETTLLTEFHKWASPMELRVKSHATAMRALDLEIEDVKERLTKLEPPTTSRH